MGEQGREDPAAGADPDWLDDGPPPLTATERRRRRNILFLLVGLVVLISSVAVVVNRTQVPAVSDPEPVAASSPPPAAGTPTKTSRPAAGPVVVSNGGSFAPGITDGVLFARSSSTVYRMDLKTGRVVATPGAETGSTGQAAFIAGRSQVIIRPWDSVPGVVVPDDRRPRALTGLLGEGVQVLPGPPGHVWVNREVNYERDAVMTLVSLDEGLATTSVSGGGSFESDGVGGLLMTDVGGVWEVTPQGFRRLTTGAVAAMGPHHYLLVNCDREHRCSSALFDRSRRSQRTLGPIDTAAVPEGSISPDGRFVAVVKSDRRTNVMLDVISLKTGASIVTAPQSEDSLYNVADSLNTLVWSSDSRYLFAMSNGSLIVIDPRTGRIRTPALPMHDLLQLTLRP